MDQFRPTAGRGAKTFFQIAALALATMALLAPSALAFPHYHGWGSGYLTNPAPQEVNEELAVCPGQTFSQPFTAFADDNYYTLVGGSQFNAGPEGWILRRGAAVASAARPDGSDEGVLELPAGSWAVSPPVCVTLQYPTARTWVQTVEGDGALGVGVVYAGGRYGPARAQQVGLLGSEEDGQWDLSDPFEVKPELGGSADGTREVRFVFANRSWHSAFQLWGVYVDPRMR